MSKPRTDYEDLLSGLHQEILHAISALNMRDDLLPGVSEESDNFLADKYKYAYHAREHLQAADEIIAMLRRAAQHERDKRVYGQHKED